MLCRFVQLAPIRLPGNSAIMREYAISASAAWKLIEELPEDERLDFASGPAALSEVMPKMPHHDVPTPKLVSDAYLAAFSIAGGMRLTTMDRGFQRYRGIEIEFPGI